MSPREVDGRPLPDLAKAIGVTDPTMADALNKSVGENDPAPIRTLEAYLSAPIKSPPELVTPRFLIRGGVTVTVGDAGKGKTSLGLNRILAWAAGKAQFVEVSKAFVPTAPIRTLVIENEGAGGLFQEKIQTMLVNAPARFTKDDIRMMQENVLIWGEGGYAGVKLDDPRKLAQVRRGIEEWKPDVVLMEPFARMHTGDENSNTETNALLSTMEELAGKTDVAIMLSHHQRKGREVEGDPMDRARGASALSGAVTYMEQVKPIRAGKQRELNCTKNRYGPTYTGLVMEWQESDSGWYDFVPHENTIDEVLERLDEDEGATVKELAEALNDSEKRIRNILNAAWAAEPKRVRRVQGSKGDGGYRWLLPSRYNNDTEAPGY